MDIKTERNEFTQVQNIETAFPNKTELIYKVVRTKDFSIDSSHNQVYFLIRQNDGREDSEILLDIGGAKDLIAALDEYLQNQNKKDDKNVVKWVREKEERNK